MFSYTSRADKVISCDKHSAEFLWYLKKPPSSTSLACNYVIVELCVIFLIIFQSVDCATVIRMRF